MKFFEFEGHYETRPQVYVDMDGVLADFFGEVARQHEVDYWREIHRKNIGVDQVAQQPGFYQRLPKLPNAGKFMKGLLNLVGRYNILTSPLMSAVARSSEEKSQWLEQHLKNHPPQSVIFDHEKYKYAQQPNETPNILIDDWDTNIELWRANGGIGILYKDENWQDALRQLKQALQGKIQTSRTVVAEKEHTVEPELLTNRTVLDYVTGTHHDYRMPDPIMAHKTWVLKSVPVRFLKTSEYVHQDDPYLRVVDIDWDHVRSIDKDTIYARPVVIDSQGWVLDGNHRAVAAKLFGLKRIPALMPYNK